MKTKHAENFIREASKNFTDYRSFVSQLEKYVVGNLDLQHKQNPIVRRLKDLGAKDILFAIKEYSQFSNEAVHMLLDARVRTHEWKKLAQEIDRNIEEEKGKETLGVPHLEIMRKGYRLSFDFDVNNYEPSEVTKSFLHSMRRIFKTKDNAFQSGALLAFESVSIPEFYVLDSLVEKCENHLHTLKRNEYTAEYIKGHKFFEIGHREGLLNAIEEYIKADQASDFATGYLAVCVTMSSWWNNLNDSITFNRHQE
jgi:hypothetical protein